MRALAGRTIRGEVNGKVTKGQPAVNLSVTKRLQLARFNVHATYGQARWLVVRQMMAHENAAWCAPCVTHKG